MGRTKGVLLQVGLIVIADIMLELFIDILHKCIGNSIKERRIE